MKGRTIVIAALVTIAVFSVAGVAVAGPWMGRLGGLGGLGKAIKDGTTFTPPAQTLGLTDEQVAQVQEIQETATEKIQAIQMEMFAIQAELRSLLWQKSPDQSLLTAKYEEIAELRQEMADIATQAREEFLALLTPEQQTKYNETPGLGVGACGRGGGFRMGQGKAAKGIAPTSPTGARGAKLTVKGL